MVEVLDYGRFGCMVKEFCMGFFGEGDIREEVMDDFWRKFWSYIEFDFVLLVEGLVCSIEKIII